MKVIFINSFPRSGSTLLGSLLGMHPDIRYLGEVRNAFPNSDSTAFDSEAFSNDEFWSSVQHQLSNVEKPLTTKLGDGTTEGACFNNIRTIYNAADIASEGRWIVDSSHRTREIKSHLQNLEDVMTPILLTRDGRAVLNSVLKRRAYKSVVKNSLSFLYKWNKFNIGVYALKRSMRGVGIVHVRYENLCHEPLLVLNYISSTLGISEFHDSHYTDNSSHVFIGGSSSFSGAGEGLDDLKEDLSWRQELPTIARVLFLFFGSTLNRMLGYR